MKKYNAKRMQTTRIAKEKEGKYKEEGGGSGGEILQKYNKQISIAKYIIVSIFIAQQSKQNISTFLDLPEIQYCELLN